MSGPEAEIRPGNALPLRNIPVGTVIHAIEMKPGAGAKMARSAREPASSSWRRRAPWPPFACPAARCGSPAGVPRTVGVVGNPEHELI